MASSDESPKTKTMILLLVIIYMVVLIMVAAGMALLAMGNSFAAVATFVILGLLSFVLVSALQFRSWLLSSYGSPLPPERPRPPAALQSILAAFVSAVPRHPQVQERADSDAVGGRGREGRRGGRAYCPLGFS
ncbi:hypothetical protein C7M84_021118 [Penaeus vannamei]|uniref:Uncharacterized protein n=1 Tax=Penaeus vannamei TaxID=6689 RepID=A0A3R7PWR5_PENVA|nr:uncharacterized protein LOC113827269 [Penaeus vannamei]ROT85138.1 hypothetical protein C7M84_021118 [Penaeus vannamei]